MIDWRHWHNEPWLIGGLVALGWLWAVLAGPWRARLAWQTARTKEELPAVPFPRGHAVRFYSSLLVFYVAVGSPLDQIAERFLFSAHMLQHQLLIYPAAILFLLGIPSWMIDPVLTRAVVREPLRLLTSPVVAALVYSLVIGVWHAPTLYDLALQNKTVHVLEHITFFLVALIYWWPLLSPSHLLPKRNYGVQMLYLVAVVVTMTPVFAYITFSDHVLYPTYEFAPRILENFSAAEDQLLAGTMMKLIGMVVSLGAFMVAFYRWYQEKK